MKICLHTGRYSLAYVNGGWGRRRTRPLRVEGSDDYFVIPITDKVVQYHLRCLSIIDFFLLTTTCWDESKQRSVS
jgi:hypothetical protein